MKKYILIDTWNGEGYSDSTAKLKEFQNSLEIDKYCLNNVTNSIGNKKSFKITRHFNESFISYDIKGDSGCLAWVEYTGQFGIVLDPMTNSFSLLKTYSDYKLKVNELLENKTLCGFDEDEVEALEKETTDDLCFSGLAQDMIFVKF